MLSLFFTVKLMFVQHAAKFVGAVHATLTAICHTGDPFASGIGPDVTLAVNCKTLPFVPFKSV